MHNVSTRANTIVTFAITVLGVFAALNALTTYIFSYKSVVNAGNFKAEWAKSFDNIDEGHIIIDLTHDVSGVFNWSVKQLFMWVSIEYFDPDCGDKQDGGCSQESVIWDKIITHDSPHTDRIKITPESRRECPNPRTPYCHYYYNLREDRGMELRGAKATVKVNWSVMPTCGQIWFGAGESKSFKLPDTESRAFDFYNFRANYQ